jgi:hypothetical protein
MNSIQLIFWKIKSFLFGMADDSEKELQELISQIEKEVSRMGSSMPNHVIPTLILLAKIVAILGKRANNLSSNAERLNKWIMILTLVLCVLTLILVFLALLCIPPIAKRLFP